MASVIKTPKFVRCTCREKYGDNPDCQKHPLRIRNRSAEHERLRSAVVEAAQELREATRDISVDTRFAGELAILEGAVKRLNKFEASIGQKDGD